MRRLKIFYKKTERIVNKKSADSEKLALYIWYLSRSYVKNQL